MNSFQKRKKDVLSKLDKSSKRSWDVKIVSLCEKINSLENFYTTSSCSGRIVLIVDNSKKGPGLFVNVWHEKINVEELKKSLEKIQKSDTLRVYPDKFSSKISTKGNIKFKKKDQRSSIGLNLNIKFKQEPVILHVACESLEQSLDFLKKAREVGFKRGGIISGGKRFVLELIGTEKLEFPIISEGKILVEDEFLKLIVEKSNENLKKSFGKIERLKNIL